VIFWALLALGLLIAELATTALVSIWFVAGALCAMILALLGVSLFWQIALFAAVSLVLFLVCRKSLKRSFLFDMKSTQTEAGKTGIVTEPFDKENPGRITVAGRDWRALGYTDGPFQKGESVQVVMVKGATLYVKPAVNQEDINLEEQSRLMRNALQTANRQSKTSGQNTARQ
jgi:membrane protein implicated in regulation of membrane protease activity